MMVRRTLPSLESKTRPGKSLLPALAASLVLSLALAGCSSGPSVRTIAKAEVDPKLGVKPSPRVVAFGKPVPKGGGRNMTGKPYTVAGKRYVPKLDPDYEKTGLASWYGDAFHGRYTANGEIYDANHLSAAHPTMPLPSYARVTSMTTGRSVMVRVNDRGPFHSNRILDVSRRTAEMLGIRRAGIAKVKVEYVGPAPTHGDDTPLLLASYRGPADPGPIGVPETMVASADTGTSLPGVISDLLPSALTGSKSTPAKAAPAKAEPAPVAVASAEAPVAKSDFPAVAAVIPPVRPAVAEEAYVVVASVDPAEAYFAAGPVQVASAAPAASNAQTLDGLINASFQVGPQPVAYQPAAAAFDGTAPEAGALVPIPEAAPLRSSYAVDRIDQAYEAVTDFDQGVALNELGRDLERASNRSLPTTVIQVGVFANPENAERVADALHGIGRIAVDDVAVGGRPMKQVRVAALADGVTVEQALAAVLRTGSTGAVVTAR